MLEKRKENSFHYKTLQKVGSTHYYGTNILYDLCSPQRRGSVH